ncbi:hypothetical protein [Actinomadura sp. WAC 06369]|uniref:hypothetical protein n=1 Tax=Actinomadura sp. WAC 06369 TaxID=2203193 RepID=UPI000F76CA9B|nr:hypothetical protein [Actinomadura sp. WAC 06369]RSN51956.1 hypothetical protein DMH08_29545 [Actinomadura sp. WAC 06369]
MLPPPTGATYSPLLFVVPVIVLLSVLFWIGLTIAASRMRIRSRGREDGLSHRGGPVMGGVLQGSPSQRTRRDRAVTEEERRAAAHRAELERRREAELAAERARTAAKGPAAPASGGLAVLGRAARALSALARTRPRSDRTSRARSSR